MGNLARLQAVLGLDAFPDFNSNEYLLLLSRSVRLFAYGTTSVVLALYLHNLGFSDSQLGLLLSLTLLGDVIVSLVIALYADTTGRKTSLLVGYCLVAFAGFVLASINKPWFWVVLCALTIGTLSPSGVEAGPFLAVEQSVLASSLPPHNMTSAIAWYNLVGYATSALGCLEAGALVTVLQRSVGLSLSQAYRVIFLQYGLLGLLLIAILSAYLSPVLEGRDSVVEEPPIEGKGNVVEEPPQPERRHSRSRLRNFLGLSSASQKLVLQLSALSALDSFGGAFVTGTLLAYYFHVKFGVSSTYLGALLFVSDLIAGVSSLLSGWLSHRYGLLNTMVFSQLPANVLIALVPLMPNLALATAMVILRYSISQMNMAPRQSFLAGIVRLSERTATLGITNTAKSLGAAIGPVLTGRLAASGHFEVAFFLCGALKTVYDLALLFGFKHLEAGIGRGEGSGDVEGSSSGVGESESAGGEGEVENSGLAAPLLGVGASARLPRGDGECGTTESGEAVSASLRATSSSTVSSIESEGEESGAGLQRTALKDVA